ncbi:MAG TPA: translation initiation factor eIF-1A [Candidatus Nanoarchaeia archaeon]|nr:translation initiation factor eIF-1A [Candidatus Nanoarchaeia archaeon]
MSKKKEEAARQEELQEQISRIHLPRGRQVFGVVQRRLGGSRMEVKCFDGKTRICRIPGRLKRRLWVREGDIIIVEPWEFSGDDKGDVIYKYTKAQVEYLKRKGYLKQIEDFEEF